MLLLVQRRSIPASREALLPRPAGVAAPEEDAVDLTLATAFYPHIATRQPANNHICEAPVASWCFAGDELVVLPNDDY